MNKNKVKTFGVKYLDRRGRKVSTFVDAKTEKDMKDIVSRRGKIISYKERKFALEFAMTPAERQTFLRNLSTLLASKKGASDALRAIEYSFSGTIKMVSSKMLGLMESGISLINALEKVCNKKHFPETTMALIKAGERSGKTWKALRDAADFEMEMEELKRGSNRTIYIAIFGFLFAFAMVFTIEIWIKDMFVEYMKPLGGDMDLKAIDLLSFFTRWSMGILGFVFIALLLLSTVIKKIAPFSADQIILKVPFYNTLVLAKNNYITLYGLSLMVGSGVSMERSLQLAANSAKKGALRTDLENASKAVKRGMNWPPIMQTFTEIDRAALDGAVDKNQISNILHHLARNNRDTYKSVAATFGPTLMMISAIYVILAGAILFGYTMLPMLQTAASAFQ